MNIVSVADVFTHFQTGHKSNISHVTTYISHLGHTRLQYGTVSSFIKTLKMKII